MRRVAARPAHGSRPAAFGARAAGGLALALAAACQPRERPVAAEWTRPGVAGGAAPATVR